MSLCHQHDAPLFQPHNGCNCDPKNTMMAERVDVVRASAAGELVERTKAILDGWTLYVEEDEPLPFEEAIGQARATLAHLEDFDA